MSIFTDIVWKQFVKNKSILKYFTKILQLLMKQLAICHNNRKTSVIYCKRNPIDKYHGKKTLQKL